MLGRFEIDLPAGEVISNGRWDSEVASRGDLDDGRKDSSPESVLVSDPVVQHQNRDTTIFIGVNCIAVMCRNGGSETRGRDNLSLKVRLGGRTACLSYRHDGVTVRR